MSSHSFTRLKTAVTSVAVVVAAVLMLVACNGLIGLRDPITETDEAGTPNEAGALESDAPFIEAPHPSLPTIVLSDGGHVITNATFVPITFPSFPFTTDVNGLIPTLADAGYWDQTVKEYGVSSVTMGTPITVSEAAPTAIDLASVEKWLGDKLTGDAGDFGAPSSSTVYAIFYPSTTTFTGFGYTSCNNLGGYWEELTVGAVKVPYIVVFLCSGLDGALGLTTQTTALFLSSLTDPFPVTAAAYRSTPDNVAWESGEPAVGLMCQFATSDSSTTPPAIGHPLFRAWSNAAARAGRDPCVPGAAGGRAYFNSAPVLEPVLAPAGVFSVNMTNGVHIPKGQSKTINLDLFSTGRTTGPWTVSAQTLQQFNGGAAGDLTFALDRASGKNGDVLHLTISVAAAPKNNTQIFVISSVLGDTTNYWRVLVTN